MASPPLGSAVQLLGRRVADKYLIDRVLGRGGMSLVVGATHIQLGQRVALKVLCSPARDPYGAVVREARHAAKLTSKHTVRVFDVGIEAFGPYIVMEHLAGRNLAEVLKEEGPLSVARASSLVLEACEAVAEAHAAGIIHRDLKPSNLFLAECKDGPPVVKVLDFGIAEELQQSERGQSASGSLGYASPEQLGGQPADARADIFSLGAVLYKLVSGELPFRERRGPASPPRLYGVPAGFEAVILRCLHHDRAARYGSVAELVAALAPFAVTERARETEAEVGPLVVARVIPSQRAALPLGHIAALVTCAALVIMAVLGRQPVRPAAAAVAAPPSAPTPSAMVALPPAVTTAPPAPVAMLVPKAKAPAISRRVTSRPVDPMDRR